MGFLQNKKLLLRINYSSTNYHFTLIISSQMLVVVGQYLSYVSETVVIYKFINYSYLYRCKEYEGATKIAQEQLTRLFCHI